MLGSGLTAETVAVVCEVCFAVAAEVNFAVSVGGCGDAGIVVLFVVADVDVSFPVTVAVVADVDVGMVVCEMVVVPGLSVVESTQHNILLSLT